MGFREFQELSVHVSNAWETEQATERDRERERGREAERDELRVKVAGLRQFSQWLKLESLYNVRGPGSDV